MYRSSDAPSSVMEPEREGDNVEPKLVAVNNGGPRKVDDVEVKNAGAAVVPAVSHIYRLRMHGKT